jgi:hypothetical protein
MYNFLVFSCSFQSKIKSKNPNLKIFRLGFFIVFRLNSNKIISFLQVLQAHQKYPELQLTQQFLQ